MNATILLCTLAAEIGLAVGYGWHCAECFIRDGRFTFMALMEMMR